MLFTENKILEANIKSNHLYFYHLLPKGSDISLGIVSLDWQYHNDIDAFMNNSCKYRNRLCGGWGIYPGRKPELLSNEEVYYGINKFRGSSQGCNQIYMFRYPPYSKLGKQMADILKHKDVYQIDFERLVKDKVIMDIDYGWEGSNTDNEKLTEDYYRNISHDDYFSGYREDDPNRLLFSYMNHISVTPKNGYIPKKYIKRINNPDSFKESLLESFKYPEEIPEEITDLLKRLNSYDYGFVKNGRKIHGMNNFFEDYKSLSVSEFEKYKIGVCWDYVHYEADWFKKHGYKYETFYIQVQDEDNDCPSHTYLVFYLPGSNKPYYFESSWGQYQGIEKFNNITELHNTVKKRHIESAESKCDPNSYFREKYNAESKVWEGLNCGDYMVKVSKGKIKIDEGMIMETNLKSAIDEGFILQKVGKSTVLYHGSPIQGLKYIEPRQKSINTNICNKGRLVYATDDIRFAACFGATWHDDIAKQGSWDDWNTVTMGISDKVDVTKPCSIYELYNDGSFLRIATKEVVSSSKIKVKREIRYASYLDMLKDNGIEVITLDEYRNRLRASKSKYEQSVLSESTIMENYKTDNLLFLDISKNKQEAIRYLSNRGEKYKKALDDYNGEIIIDADKDLIVGTVLIGNTKDKGFITDLWVHEYYRKNGLGKRLLDDAVKKYKGIDLTVDTDNDIAIKMYQDYGFVSIGYANNKKQYWMKLKSKLTKDDKILTETGITRNDIKSIYLEKGDICYNLNRWDPNDNNILWITGISGSGKTTLGVDLRKEFKCDRVELDYIACYYMKKALDANKHERFYKFVDADCPEATEFFDIYPHDTYGYPIKFGETEQIQKDFLNWFIPKIYGNGNLYIINGACIIDIYDPEYFIDKPIIIKEVNYLKTAMRRVYREYKFDDGYIKKIVNMIKAFKTSISKSYRHYDKVYNDYNKELKGLDGIKVENSVLESTVNDKGEEIPEKCPKCGGKIGLYLRGEPVYLCADCGEYFGVAPFNEAGIFTQFSMEEYRDYMVSGDYNLLTRYYDSRKSALSSSQVYYTLPIRGDELPDDIDTKYIEKIVIDKCTPIYKKYWKNVSYSKGDHPFKFYRLMQATDIDKYNKIILDMSHNPIDLLKNIHVYQYNFTNDKCRYSVLIFMKGKIVKKVYCMVYDTVASWIEIKFNNTIYESADSLLLPGEDYKEEDVDILTLLDNTDPKRIWLSSDWHLFQTRYKKGERNYVNIQEIVSWCKQNIKEDDIFLYLGDVSYRFVNDEDSKKAQEIMASIPGIKVIILGNHDIEAGDYNDGCGFKYVFYKELKWQNIVFTHRPINMDLYPDDYWNIHGHMHKWSEYNTTDGKKNINVYPWYYDNKPVSLHYILTHTEKLTKNNKRSNWTNMGEASILENRSDLPDSDFGIPEDRKYPLDTEQHVRSAIKLFGHAEEVKKKALAKRIKQAADVYSIEIPETTQVHKYLSESVNEELEPLIIPDSVNTIVFDIGDVLTGFRVEDVYNHNENIPHDLVGTVIKFMNNVVWDVKQRNVNFAFWDLNTMKAHLLEVMPNKIKPYVDEILKATADVVYKYHYTDELLGALRSKGFKIYYLSNWDRWNYETRYATLDNITKQMDGGVFSFQVHNEKPSLSIYRTFLDKFNLEPDQCLFFDDKKENIEAAELVGMHGMIFDHNTTPIQILKSIYASDGVTISEKRVNDMIPIIKDGVLDFIDISQISWFHLSGYRNPGIPDKELYYKNIKDAILSIYSKAFKDDDLYIYAYVFTCTKKMKPICLGEICILRDKSWKWVIQYPLSIEGNDLMNNIKTKMNEWSMASCNPVQGIMKPFILKATNDSSIFGHNIYAFSPDIVNDKYLIINENAKLEVVDASSLNDMHVEEYKFVGDIRNIKKIEEAYKTGKVVDNTFFYTALTGKPMLSEDQIDFDPNFVKVDFVKIHEQLLTEQASLRDILYEVTSNYLFNCPCYNPRITNMIGNRDDIKLYRDLEGYYVKNKSTNKRTASVEQVDLITETMISTVL